MARPIRAIYLDEPDSQPEEKKSSIRAIYLDEPKSEEAPKESLMTSLALSTPRVAEDVIKGGFNTLKSLPGYYQKSKTEIPGLFEALMNDPKHAAGQAAAGLAELGQNVFNTPHDIANYASNRLNLIPKNINEAIQMGRMPEDTEQMINQTFGEATQPGEELIRGVARNATNIPLAKGLLSAVNPMRFTSKSIAKDILATEKEMKEKYSGPKGLYNQLEEKAKNRGIEKVDVNAKDLDLDTIKKYTAEKNTASLDKLIEHPTITNAQKAISDLGYIERRLESKPTLVSEERDQLAAIKKAKSNIEKNMFKDKEGNVHNDLAEEHKAIQKGYAQEVIPYSKNKSIQKYKYGKKLADELVPLLSRGEFAATRGKFHPELKVNKASRSHPLASGIGAGLLGKKLYNFLTSENEE